MVKLLLLLSLMGVCLLSFSTAGLVGDVKGRDDGDLDVDALLGDAKDLDDDDVVAVVEAAAGVDDDDDVKRDELEGFPLEDLDEEGLELLADAEEAIFAADLDLHIAKQHYLGSRAVTSQARRKRIAPLVGRAAWMIGRAMFRRFGRSHVTRSGARVTQHYGGRGNYQTALRDFNRMRPTNVRTFNGRISGQTGRVGNYRVTVRDGSTGGGVSRPTMSVHREGSTSFTRKFRYNN